MKLFGKSSIQRQWLLITVSIFAVYGCTAPMEEEAVEPTVEASPPPEVPTSLRGDWCREKKRRITRYTVNDESLKIVAGRSGRTHEVDLACNDVYSQCEAMTIRGWGTPVTEILRLDGSNMSLTRVWGGAWNDKTYHFTFTRCPKW